MASTTSAPSNDSLVPYTGRYKSSSPGTYLDIRVDDGQLSLRGWSSSDEGGRHISFCFKDGKIKKLVQYENINGNCLILALPVEILSIIAAFALKTDDGDIHIREEDAQLRIVHCTHVPFALEKSQFKGYGNPRSLPNSFNALQYTSRAFFDLTRGKELAYNHLKVNGWTFDTFRRLEQQKSNPRWFWDGPEWFSNVRLVTLVGRFGITQKADENTLHGILAFGRDHSRATIRVTVEDLALENKQLCVFMTYAYSISEAIRGEERPSFVPRGTVVKKWRRSKTVEWVNVDNVRFIPCDRLNMKRVKDLAARKKTGYTQALLDSLGGVDGVVELVEGWYTRGSDVI